MNAGDLLVVHCWYGIIPFSHFAIDMGDGTVIQLASDPERSNDLVPDLQSMCVRQSTMNAFSGGRAVHVVDVKNALPIDAVLERAKSKLGLAAYCLVSGNCEHFARWCTTGHWTSEQVEETQHSMARTAMHAAMLISARFGKFRTASSVSGLTAVAANARVALPSLIGEVTEQVARCSLKRYNATPQFVEQGSTLVSFGTVAVLGLVLGGPAGSASALAAHSLARWTSRSARSRIVVATPGSGCLGVTE